MDTNIKDYPIEFWWGYFIAEILFNVFPVLISFFSFYIERDKFFKDSNFRNKAIEIFNKKKENIEKKNGQNLQIPVYSYQNYKESRNLRSNVNLNTQPSKINETKTNIAEVHENVDEIEKSLLNKYRRHIKCNFIITIIILLIDLYSNIHTSYNLRPRFLESQYILYNNTYLVNQNNFLNLCQKDINPKKKVINQFNLDSYYQKKIILILQINYSRT